MKIIAFEGIDGSGKSTQVKLLASALCKEGYRVKIIKFPRYKTEVGKIIRKVLFGEISMSDEAFHLLLEVDRYTFNTAIENYRDWKYDYLIFDRYTLSNLAYASAKQISFNWLKEVQKYLYKPDITFVLDMDANNVKKRKAKVTNKLDNHEEDKALLTQARAFYLLSEQLQSELDQGKIKILNGQRDSIAIFDEVIGTLNKENVVS